MIRLLRASLLLVLVWAVVGCQTLLDLERARGLMRPSAGAEIPVLVEAPAADLPEVDGVTAVDAELRAVPLLWEPVLAGLSSPESWWLARCP